MWQQRNGLSLSEVNCINLLLLLASLLFLFLLYVSDRVVILHNALEVTFGCLRHYKFDIFTLRYNFLKMAVLV